MSGVSPDTLPNTGQLVRHDLKDFSEFVYLKHARVPC
jgi:hypothetical protein